MSFPCTEGRKRVHGLIHPVMRRFDNNSRPNTLCEFPSQKKDTMVFNQQLMQNMLQSDEVDALPLSLAQSLLLHHLDHPIAVSIALLLRNESPSLPL